MNPAFLWAKSRRTDEPELPSMRLAGHLADVFEAANRVLDETGDSQLRALGLEPDRHRDRLRRCVLLAAAVHDIGKANDHFQEMVRGVRDVRQTPQGLRHEWVSILILKSLKEWLLAAVDGDELHFAFVEWAISGHHPAFDRASPPRSCPPGAGPEILVLTGHDDIRAILGWLMGTFGLSQPPVMSTGPRRLVGADNVLAELAGWAKSAGRLWDERIRGTPDSRFVAAIKGCLIAADVAGSALPREEPDESARWEWIPKSFSNLPKAGDLKKVADRRLDGHKPRKFQRQVRSSASPVTYVKAGCGTGKTLAAYLWAAKNHPTHRLYFCYPTTGTATEGFKDYLYEPDGELGELGARLFHSRRDIDLEIILNTGPDSPAPEAEAAARLESLEAWSTPIVACTVDTVLGLVRNNRRGLFAWPALSQSAFVFDEIHAYDNRLFGALLRFLRDLPGLPSLLMTASLPKAREDALARTIRAVHGFDIEPVLGPRKLERLPRYHKHPTPDDDPLDLVRRELADGGKVLWVCNIVDRVMDEAKRARDLGPLIYHSRFKYEDRVERHRGVVAAFTPGHSGPALAICSQVAEMSLDLKGCTMLVTDLAPVPSLIQRLGRLNRQAEPGDRTRPFVVVEPKSHLPYTAADLDAARSWLARLLDAAISQRHLSDLWDQSAEAIPVPGESSWLDGGPSTEVTELREASHGITVLMEEDRASVRSKPRNLARFVVPMPRPRAGVDWRAWPREKGIPVAPKGSIDYDRNCGAGWNA